jgi:sucrose-6-phosphate hydrolase SacC (GH32 family)
MELSLQTTPEGVRLFQEPVKELEALRRNSLTMENVALKPGANPLAERQGRSLELVAEFQIPPNDKPGKFGFKGASFKTRFCCFFHERVERSAERSVSESCMI